MLIAPTLPVLSMQMLDFDGMSIQRIILRPGEFPLNLERKLSVVATLGAAYEMDIEHQDRVLCDRREIYLLPPTLRRRTMFSERGEVLRLTFDESTVRRAASEIGAGEASIISLQRLTDPAIYELIHLLAEEMRPDGLRGPSYSEALGHALLGRLVRGTVQSTLHAERAGLSPQRLARCKAFIESKLTTEVTVAQMAAAVDMSVFHFTRAFKQSTGETPHAYASRRRIAAAQVMVRNTTRPLNQISSSFGFSSSSHFSAVFSRLCGVSPSEYRLRGGVQR
jgi:AraC family transcriptional regulator